MAALTKTVDGKALPASKFAMVLDPEDVSTWHLPIDEDHIDAAVRMFSREAHGSSDQRAKAARKIAAAAREHGISDDRVKNFEDKHVHGTEHADFGGQWIEIFAAGQHRPQGGWNGTATRENLNRIAASYDPQFHEAPACVGHPKDNLPAYGWVDRLKVDGDRLLAKFREVDPEFESAVTAGRYKKRSAAFYLDGGQLAGLRHVGFLGAQPPEIKGLKNLTFDDHGQSFTEVDFGEEEPVAAETDKTFGERLEAWFAEKFGKTNATVVNFSEADAKRIAAEAVTSATQPLQQKVADLQAKLDAREASVTLSETKQRAVAAVDKLKAEKKWIPAFEKMGLGVVFEELAKATGTVEFGEAGSDGKKPQVSPLQVLVTFMEGLPKIVPGGTAVYDGGGVGRRSAGQTGDPLTDAANALAKEKGIAFSEALLRVAGESPELTAVAGSGGAGTV